MQKDRSIVSANFPEKSECKTLNAFFKLVHTISNDWSDEFGSAFLKNVWHCRYRLTIIWLPIVYKKCFMNFLRSKKGEKSIYRKNSTSFSYCCSIESKKLWFFVSGQKLRKLGLGRGPFKKKASTVKCCAAAILSWMNQNKRIS